MKVVRTVHFTLVAIGMSFCAGRQVGDFSAEEGVERFIFKQIGLHGTPQIEYGKPLRTPRYVNGNGLMELA